MALISAARLRALLLNTGLQQKDPSLYQVIYDLIGNVINLEKASGGNSGGGGGGGGTTTIINRITQQLIDLGSSSDSGGNDNFYLISNPTTPDPDVDVDYVVASDGGIPDALPLNDGAGNFIYVPYTP